MAQIIQARSNSQAEQQEYALRCDMAAVFRVQARHDWNEQIGNHNSLMLPKSWYGEPAFLINPRGYLFQELKASDLIVCNLDGKVLRGKGELRKVAFHIHCRIHLNHPAATCIVHIHPRYLTALSMLEDGEWILSHHNTLMLADRTMYDPLGHEPVDDNDEGDRLARDLGEKTIMVMRGHGVTVVGPTIEDAFDECFIAERTAMYQITAMQTGKPLHVLPPSAKRKHSGKWGDRVDARLHLDAWRRLLDKEGDDYAG